MDMNLNTPEHHLREEVRAALNKYKQYYKDLLEIEDDSYEYEHRVVAKTQIESAERILWMS